MDDISRLQIDALYQYRQSSIYLTPAVQDQAAHMVAETYRFYYGQAFPDDPSGKLFEERLDDPDYKNAVRLIEQKSLSTKLGTNAFRDLKVTPPSDIDVGSLNEIKAGLKELGRAETIKDIRNTLLKSARPIFAAQAGVQAEQGMSPSEALSQIELKAMVTGIPGYIKKQGQSFAMRMLYTARAGASEAIRMGAQEESIYNDKLGPIVTKEGVTFPRLQTKGGHFFAGKHPRELNISPTGKPLGGGLEPLFIPKNLFSKVSVALQDRTINARNMFSAMRTEFNTLNKDPINLTDKPISDYYGYIGNEGIANTSAMARLWDETRSNISSITGRAVGAIGQAVAGALGYDPAFEKGPKYLETYQGAVPGVERGFPGWMRNLSRGTSEWFTKKEPGTSPTEITQPRWNYNMTQSEAGSLYSHLANIKQQTEGVQEVKPALYATEQRHLRTSETTYDLISTERRAMTERYGEGALRDPIPGVDTKRIKRIRQWYDREFSVIDPSRGARSQQTSSMFGGVTPTTGVEIEGEIDYARPAPEKVVLPAELVNRYANAEGLKIFTGNTITPAQLAGIRATERPQMIPTEEGGLKRVPEKLNPKNQRPYYLQQPYVRQDFTEVEGGETLDRAPEYDPRYKAYEKRPDFSNMTSIEIEQYNDQVRAQAVEVLGGTGRGLQQQNIYGVEHLRGGRLTNWLTAYGEIDPKGRQESLKAYHYGMALSKEYSARMEAEISGKQYIAPAQESQWVGDDPRMPAPEEPRGQPAEPPGFYRAHEEPTDPTLFSTPPDLHEPIIEKVATGKERGQAMAAGQKFLRSIPGGADAKLTYDKNVLFAEWRKKDRRIVVGDKFFDPEALTNEVARENWGVGTPSEVRERILAHEVGHKTAGPGVIAASSKYLMDLQEQYPDLYDDLMKRVDKMDPRHSYKGKLHTELAADVTASALGYPSARLQTRFHLSPDRLSELQTAAVEDMYTAGTINAQKRAEMISSIEKAAISENAPIPKQGPPDPNDKAAWVKYMYEEQVERDRITATRARAVDEGYENINELSTEERRDIKRFNRETRETATRAERSKEIKRFNKVGREANRKAADPQSENQPTSDYLFSDPEGVGKTDPKAAPEPTVSRETITPSKDFIGFTPRKRGDPEQEAAYAKHQAKPEEFTKEQIALQKKWDAYDQEERREAASRYSSSYDKLNTYERQEMWTRAGGGEQEGIWASYRGKETAHMGQAHVLERDAQGKVSRMQFIDPKASGIKPSLGPEGDLRYNIPEGEIANAKVTVPENVVKQASNVFRSASDHAISSGDINWKNPKDAVATLQKRVQQYVSSYAETLTKEAAGGSAGDQAAAAKFGRDVTSLVGEQLTQKLKVFEGSSRLAGINAKGWKDTSFNAEWLGGSQGKLEARMAASADLTQTVKDMGGSAAVAAGPRTVISAGTAPGSPSYVVGGGGGIGQGGDWVPAGGQQGRSRGSSMWSGGMGRMLYGAYIGKRLWSMTAAPVMQAVEEYGTKAAAYAPMTTGDLMKSTEGHVARQTLSKSFWEKGAYEQFGAFSDFGYALSGSDPEVARAAAGVKMTAGLASAGYVMGVSSQMFGGLAAAGGATTAAQSALVGGMVTAGHIGVGVGLAGLAVQGAMTYHNLTQPDEEPWTWGGMWREGTGALQIALAEGALRTDTGERSTWDLSKKQLRARPGYAEDVGRYMSPEMANYIGFEKDNDELDYLKSISREVTRQTGEETTALQPSIRALTRAMGETFGTRDEIKDIASASRTAGMTFAEYTQGMLNVGGQMGFAMGSEGMREFMGQYAELDAPGRIAMAAKAGQVSSYGAQLQPYFADPYAGAGIARDYDITTATQAQPLQQAYAASTQYGLDLEEVAYGTWSIDPGEVKGKLSEEHRIALDVLKTIGMPVPMDLRKEIEKEQGGRTGAMQFVETTYGEYIAEIYGDMESEQAMLAAKMASPMMARGMDPMAAIQYAQAAGIETELQWTNVNALMSGAERFGALTQEDMAMLSVAGTGQNQYQVGMINQMAPAFAKAGANVVPIMGGLATAGMSNADMSMLTRMVGGDVGAWSYQSYQNNDLTWRTQNQAGMPIQSTSGDQWSQMFSLQAQRGNWGARYAQENILGVSGVQVENAERFTLIAGGTGPGPLSEFKASWQAATPDELLAGIFGDHTEAMEAFKEGGTIGMNAMYRSKSADLAMASAGLQAKGVRMQQEFLWGEGSWDSPEKGSWYWYEDKQTKMRHRSTMADFASSRERMDMNQRFAIQQEGISGRRMEAGHLFQRWTATFDRQSMAMRQEWGREDWQYQDTMTGLSTEWTLEDFDESLRTAHGRDRRNIMRKRERFITQTNLEGEQKDTVRGRQETTWKREDDRFEAQVEHSETLMGLDKEQFELGKQQRVQLYEFELAQWERKKEEYMAQYALEQQMRDLQREHQAEQLELQLAQAGIAAAQAKLAKDQAEDWENLQPTMDLIAGSIDQFMKNDPEAAFVALEQMGIAIGAIDLRTATNVSGMMKNLSEVPAENANRLASFMWQLANLDTGKINALIRLLNTIYTTGAK